MDALPLEIGEKVEDVRVLCEKYGVKRLTLFGSAVMGSFDPATSDIDFLVELIPLGDPIAEGRAYLGLWNDLERLFGRRVDLVEAGSVVNPYVAMSIERSHRDLYEAA
jgi:uncharacterized protein